MTTQGPLSEDRQMKLIFCPSCQDVRKLQSQLTRCACGSSWGYYMIGGVNARYGGEAIPLGILNESFLSALQNRPMHGKGERFDAFVIPKICPTCEHSFEGHEKLNKIHCHTFHSKDNPAGYFDALTQGTFVETSDFADTQVRPKKKRDK